MKDQIVIRISPLSDDLNEDTVVDWGLFDEHSQVTASGRGPIKKLAAEFELEQADCAINIVVPGQSVLLCKTAIPTNKVSQLKRALPYMVEELLADDIENVHLALSTPIDFSVGTIDVMVIGHRVLINYLDVFRSNGLSPDLITPDLLAVPIKDESWSITIEKNESIIRTGTMSGMTCANADLELLFESLLTERRLCRKNVEDTLDAIPGGNKLIFDVIASEQDELSSELASNIAKYLRENYDFLDVKENLYEETVSELIISTCAFSVINEKIKTPANFLQRGYKVGKEGISHRHYWRKVASIAVVGLLSYLALSIGSGWYFSNEANRLKQESIVLYKQLFPNERRIISLRKQFQNHLQGVGSNSSSSSFLNLLSRLSEGMNLESSTNDGERGLSPLGISINKLKYDQGIDGIQLELKGKSIDQLDQLKNKLANVGLAATVNSATEEDNSMLSRVFVEEL